MFINDSYTVSIIILITMITFSISNKIKHNLVDFIFFRNILNNYDPKWIYKRNSLTLKQKKKRDIYRE